MAKKIIVIDGYIGPYGYSKQFIRNEMTGHAQNPVTIKISSLGGSVDDALNIYDQFIEHGNVTAELSAFVASSATLISLGAKTVRMNENSFYLIHKIMNWVDEYGPMNEDQIEELIAKLESKKQQLVKMTLQIARMYVKKTGKTLNEIIDLMKKETWLTAEEAKEWGFVDEVYVPDEAVNYLDNLQMVAMITGNGMPEPPRKNTITPPVPQPVNEESILNKLWNRFIAKQREVTLKNKISMRQFSNLNRALNVEALECSDEGVFLNEEQLGSIEASLEANQQLVSEREQACAATNSAIAERDAVRTELANVLNPFDSIDASVAAAETPEAKAAAIRTLLAARPAAAPIVNLETKDPMNEGFDGFSKEEMEVIKNL